MEPLTNRIIHKNNGKKTINLNPKITHTQAKKLTGSFFFIYHDIITTFETNSYSELKFKIERKEIIHNERTLQYKHN